MNQSIIAVLVACSLFLGMLALLEIGRRVGRRRHAKDTEGARAGIGAIEGSMFGLLGLLIAFTFSSAAARFDHRRALIVEEANAIGTAYLRIDLLPTPSQEPMRALFRDYLDSRLRTYAVLPDLEAAYAELAKTIKIQNAIWSSATATTMSPGPTPITPLIVGALNQMFDIVTTRTAAAQMHSPLVIFLMLGILTLTGALLAGFGMAGGKSRSLLHMIAFALVMATTVYVIFDLEYPRVGVLRVDAFDQVLVDLRKSMD